jgi:hypothetical protein
MSAAASETLAAASAAAPPASFADSAPARTSLLLLRAADSIVLSVEDDGRTNSPAVGLTLATALEAVSSAVVVKPAACSPA